MSQIISMLRLHKTLNHSMLRLNKTLNHSLTFAGNGYYLNVRWEGCSHLTGANKSCGHYRLQTTISLAVRTEINVDHFWFVCFVVRGESPGCRLISTASMFERLRNLLPHHSQGSSMERWSRNTLRVVTARAFYVLRVFLTSPFILNNSVETAAPFNVVSHPRCCEPRN